MKIQIRRGVFETNSSSTHSLQLVHKDLDGILEIINNSDKLHNNIYYSNEFNETEKWISEGVLTINSLKLRYSNYDNSYYYIFNTLISKVYFIGMLYFSLSKKFFDTSNMDKDAIIEKMKSLPLFDKINMEVIKAFKKSGYNINSVNWQVYRFTSFYNYTYNEKWNNLFTKKTIDEDKLLTIVKRILKPGFSVSFADIAHLDFKKITYVI